MSERRIRLLVVALVVAQILLLVGMPALHGARIAAGTEIRLAVRPIDPVDLARGSYVTLDYDLTEIRLPDWVQAGDHVYVELRPGAAGAATTPTGRVVRDPAELPDDALWIRLPVNSDGRLTTEMISTWYADSASARAAEQRLADGSALAVISLDNNGDPTLRTLETD